MPTLKTTSQDVEAYQARRTGFLDSQLMFKTGFAEHGVLALNYLTQMYYILPAGRHIKLNETKSEEFVDSIDTLRKYLIVYMKRKGEVKDKNYIEFADYAELDNRFDKLVRAYYKILFEVGFSP